MATWIAHLRIAENLLGEISGLDPVAFTFGSLAPDSGIPNADWTQFDPPKEVTHFLRQGEGEQAVHDLEFYRAYLAGLKLDGDAARYSFILGYYLHLVCDRLWAYRIGVPSKHAYANLIAERGNKEAWGLIKDDWYGLDQLYVHAHPKGIFWRVLMRSNNPPQYLPFVTEAALNQQLDYIRKFYSEPEPAWLLDRPYPYLNEVTMSRWIVEASASLLKIYKRFDEIAVLNGAPSVLALIDPSEFAMYDAPLGDVGQIGNLPYTD
ncbi:MAG: hypothetical protein HZB51_15700 [Chloroflexi bacterium]|nr:hypothetical protein [Chloroflexota bacterium]